MTSYRYSWIQWMKLAGVGLVLMGMCIGNGHIQATESASNPGPQESSDGIQVQADELVINNKSRQAEFSGNVMVRQKNNEISCNHLKIFYSAKVSDDKNTTGGDQTIEKLVAWGNVHIKFDDIVATTAKAVYTLATRVLVLEGENTVVTMGKDTISGSSITIHRDTMKFSVNGGVKVKLFPGDKGLK